MEEIVVLSLFDGMSCGQQALDRRGIKPTYYASEIDKYAIKVTMANYPNTIQLGSVVDVDVSKLKPINLLIGGPCQSFSFAGKRKGMSTKDSIEIFTLDHYLELKSQNFEFEGQSYLFWEYMRILTDIRKYNPDVKFLLENVIMGEKWQRILTTAIGINPIEINSSLVSAQNRRRLFWTNIGAEPDGLFGDLVCKIPQPKDKGILLKDILEENVPEKYFLSDKMIDVITKHGAVDNLDNDKSNCILTSYHKMGGRDQQYIDETFKGLDVNSKSRTIRKGGKGTATDKHNWDLIRVQSQKDRLVERTGVDIENEKEPIILDVYNKKLKDDYKVPTLTDPIHNNIRLVVPNVTGGDFRHDEGFRWRENGKSPTLTARGRNTDSKDYTGQPLIKINDIVAMRGRPNEDGVNEQQIEANGIDKSNTLTSVQKDNLVRERELIIHNIPEIVSVRKYDVDIKKLQECLKSHKKYNNKKIADLLDVPKTMVDHWFRSDDYFSIPDKNIWLKLKELLEIKTDEFDDSIMIFEEKEGVFEKSNRVYDENGLAPTLTSTSADEKVLVRELNENQLSKLNLNVDTDKSNCITLAQGRAGSSSEYMDAVSKIAKITSRIRRLTPVECERLQCVNDGYTKKGLENHFQIFNFTGNKFTICEKYVKKIIVTNQFQTEKLNYATNTIIDLLEMEKLNCQDLLLTTLKNVSWRVVKENNNPQQKRVLCTIKDGKDMVYSLFQNELINQTLSVNFACRKLENTEVLECATSITKCLDCTEIHYILNKKELILHEDIIEIPMELNFTEKLLNKKSVENLLKESKSFTILTLINLIIIQIIYKSLQNQNTPVLINNLIKLQDNSLELELSYIETENIVLTSDSARYRMLGNGWTVSVIEHIFKYLPSEFYG